jgi:uncharacterized protein HemX
MYNVKQAAEILRLSTRSIQLKCKKHKVSKIGNEFQITDEILELWKTGGNERRNERQVVVKSSQRNVTSFIRFVIAFLIVLFLGLAVLFYRHLTNEIEDAKLKIIKNETKYQFQLDKMDKQLEDADKVIRNQDREIQRLKYKDSLRIFKKW